jgi:hypothetical protein
MASLSLLRLFCCFTITIIMLLQLSTVSAQDKVYFSSGKVAEGKVVEVAPHQVKMLLVSRPNGPLYSFNIQGIDSVIYADGTKEDIKAHTAKRAMNENIPQLNSVTFDQFGFLFYSVDLCYERRLANGFLGFRIPVYISYEGERIAGEGLFNSAEHGWANFFLQSGYAIATGLNPKFYPFKHRIVRAFIGPEVTIGYTRYRGWTNTYYNPTLETYNNGTLAILGKFGLMLTPVDRFNMTIDGGVGAGDFFGPNSGGLIGLWHVGFAIGVNF